MAALDWPLRIVVLPTLCDPAFMEKKSPGHTLNMALYDRMLLDSCRESGATYIERSNIFMGTELAKCFYGDGYHLNAVGAGLVAKALARVITSLPDKP